MKQLLTAALAEIQELKSKETNIEAQRKMENLEEQINQALCMHSKEDERITCIEDKVNIAFDLSIENSLGIARIKKRLNLY